MDCGYEKVNYTVVDGVIVSIYYNEFGQWETLISDENDTYPVERYLNPDIAFLGYTQWIENMKGKYKVEFIKVLEHYEFIENEIIKLKRWNNENLAGKI